MLHGAFNLVRHHEFEPQKSNIAVYIWQKLGLFSTFNCVQKFLAEKEQYVSSLRYAPPKNYLRTKTVSAVFIKSIL